MEEDTFLSERISADINKVCRLCLKGNDVLAPIFGGQPNGSGTSLPHRIMSCAQVKVAEGDGLPPNVCTSCLSQLDRSYQFKLLCEHSDSALRGNVKGDNPSDDECSDSGELWDMTTFTPEVIIKEDTDDSALPTNGEGDESGSYYGNHLQAVLANNLLQGGAQIHLSHGPHISTQLRHPSDSDSLSLRLSQPSPHIDLRTTPENLMLNGLVFPLAPSLSHLPPPPPPGPSNNGNRSRRCRSGDKLFKCRQCNKSYSFSSALSRHKAVHNTALRPHVCQVCRKGFTDAEKLIRHEKTHSLEFLMTCDLCHRPFRSYSSFQKHRATGVCKDVCEDDVRDQHPQHQKAESNGGVSHNPSVTREKLREEERPVERKEKSPPPAPSPPPPARGRDSGKGKPEFKCHVCQKLFATRGSLDVHSTIHTGVRPFVCSACHKSFRHKVNLMEHFQRKHSQVRPYICDICASRFVTKQELVRHYRKHIGD